MGTVQNTLNPTFASPKVPGDKLSGPPLFFSVVFCVVFSVVFCVVFFVVFFVVDYYKYMILK